MPLYNEEQKNFIVTKMGYNPSEFDYDEISNTVIKRPAKLSPSTSEVVDDGKVELPEVQQELFSPLQTGVGTFAESALPAVTGGYVAGNVAKAVSPLMGKGIAGTLGGIGLIAASGLLSGRIAKAAQDAAANTIMPETMDTLQQSQIDNPTAATLGGLASIPLGGMWPNLPNVGRAIGTIPKLAIGMAPKAEEVANLSNVAGGAAIGTGIDWLNAKSQNAEFNPVESLLINTIFNKPNILGRKYGFTDPADLPPSEPTREFLAKPQEDKIQGVEVFNPETRPYLSNEEFWNDLAKLRNASKEEPLSYSLEPQKIEKPEFVSSITKRGYSKEEVKQGSKEFEDRMKELRSKIPFLNKETKYQDVPTEKPVYTRQQQEFLDKVKVDDDPINTTKFWNNFWNELSARRNVRVTEDGTIVNAQTGKPVAGQASERVGNEPVDVRINPKMAGADTRPHELSHPFLNDLAKSTRDRDKIILQKYYKIIENDPDYVNWQKERLAQKLDGSVEEYAATNSGTEAVKRALANSKDNTTKQNIKNWWRDVSSYYKTRFTKHATIDEMQRVINYKMLHDPDFASVFKKSAITTQNVSKTIENNKDLNTPEFKLVGSQMWKGREIPESMVTPEMNNFIIENYGDFFKRHPIGSKVKASNPDGGGSFYGIVKGHSRMGNLQVELPDGSIRYSSEKQIFGEGLKDSLAATVAPKNVEETSANTSVKNQEQTMLFDKKEDRKIVSEQGFKEMKAAVENAPEPETNVEIQPKKRKPNYPLDDKNFKFSDESPFAQKEKEKRGPFYLETAKYLDDNFKNNADKEIDANQLISTIRNKFPSEYETLNEIVNFRDAFPAGSKISPAKLQAFIQENGPSVEVKKLLANKPPFEDTALANTAEFRKGEQRRNELQHEFETDPAYSVIPNDWIEAFRYNPRFEATHDIEIRRYLKILDLPDDKINKIIEFKKLDSIAKEYYQKYKESDVDSATRAYQQVNPKPLENMPDAVDLLVRIPVKDRAKYESSHYPQSGENLLAHVRGYMETLPNGKKVFHVFELQSDWAQDYRNAIESLGNVKEVNGEGSGDWSWVDNNGIPHGRQYRTREEALKNIPNDVAKINDPLLKHYERLAVKAAINHAKENGADYIAISDAETAMMTEQHDKVTRMIKPISVKNTEEYYGYDYDDIKYSFGDDWKKGKYLEFNNQIYRVDKPENNLSIKVEIAKELAPYTDKGKENYISQEKGMRFHYDNSLPRIAEDLTGSKGESVSFGEHQNKGSDVFKNAADGSPKTDITARMYPISGENVKDTFTLTKKKYSTESILKQTETPEFKRWFEGSKVVDSETGKPLVVYHGSSENDGFSVFDKSKVTDREEGRKRGYVDWLGHVNYFTPSKREASAFALNEKSGDSAAVYPVYLNIKNPFDTRQEWKSKETKNFLKEAINFFNKNSDEYLNQRIDFIYGNQSLKEIYKFLADKFGGADEANKFLIKKGYDGIIDKSHDIGLQYATFYPEQIKSAIGNSGKFDPKNPDIRYSTESILKQTETPEFKKWFGDSKVVDPETGKPLVVYHGTQNPEFTKFNTSGYKASGYQFGEGAYFTAEPSRASGYAKDKGAIYPTFVSLKKPYVTDTSSATMNIGSKLEKDNPTLYKDLATKIAKDNNYMDYSVVGTGEVGNRYLREQGYDGIIYHYHGKDFNEVVAFYPEQIKSATGNTGAFDPKNPDIRYSTSSALFEFRKPEIEKIRTLKHKDADKVADAFTDFYRSYDRYKGKFAAIGTDKLIDKLSYTDPKERFFQDNQKYRDTVQYLDDMMDYGKSSIKPDPEVLQIIKDVNAETLKSKAASMDLGDLEGHEYYLAQVQSRKVMSMLLNEPDSPKTKALLKDWFTYYKDVLGKNRDEALEALRIFKAGFNKQNSDLASQYGPIDKAAGVGIPSSWREKNLIDRLGRFVNRYSRRLAHIDNIESNKIVQDALNDPEKGLAGADVVRNVMFNIEGQRDIAEANREVISGLVRSAWMGTLTGVKDFTSNLFLGMQHQTLDQAMLSPFKAWSNMKQNLKESFEAGVNRKNIGALEMLGDDATINEVFQYLRRGRDILNTVSGRNYLEKVTRATAFGQGKWLAQDNIWRAHKNRLNSQSEKFLNDFVPNWKSYVKSGILPADVLERAATDYVGSVQGTYDPRGLPIIAQRGSLAPYLSLSRWSIEKLNNFEKHVVKPAMQGNYKPLLNQTIGLMIGGAAVNAIVEELTGKKEKTPKLKELKEIASSGNDPILPLTYKLAAYASLSGYAGMYGDVAKMIMDKTYKNRIQTMNNPVIEGTYMLGKNTADYLQALKDEGVTPENVGKFIEQNLEDYFQIYRLMAANTSEDKKKEIEKSNEFRDLKLYRNTHGEETSDVTTDRANPFKDQDIKKFREEEDVTKILPEAEKLIAKAFENADGDIFKLRKELRKIKFNSNRTMPSIDESPDSFQKYLLYLEKTQGRDEAVRRMTKYFKDRALNKSKSDLVPDV